MREIKIQKADGETFLSYVTDEDFEGSAYAGDDVIIKLRADNEEGSQTYTGKISEVFEADGGGIVFSTKKAFGPLVIGIESILDVEKI